MDYGKCATQSTHKIITAQENKRKLTIKNPQNKFVSKIQVDGCLPIKSGKRCDYMFEIGTPPKKIIYLELKGCDIEKAYMQLVSTIDTFHSAHHACQKECHIVASRIPKAGPKVQQLKIKMLKTKQAALIVNTNQAVITA